MDSNRKMGIIVGLLFIIATVTAILTIGFLGSTIEPPLNFNTVSENEINVIISVIFWLILSVSVIGIGFMMYPILKKYHEGLAIGYVSLRIVEGICIIISSITLLSILTISKEFVKGSLESTHYQTVGTLLLAIQDWSFLIGTLIFLGLGGLILYYLLYELELVPRFLSIWGLVGAALVTLYGLLGLFDFATDSVALNILAAPIAVQEMVFAVWLIIKGFMK
jgi:hypothetical protein